MGVSGSRPGDIYGPFKIYLSGMNLVLLVTLPVLSLFTGSSSMNEFVLDVKVDVTCDMT